MIKTGYNIRVMNEKFGELVNETFMDQIQFKLFLKMVHASIELKDSLTFSNGDTFFINIPSDVLKNCIVVTNTKELTMSEQVRSKIESLVTK